VILERLIGAEIQAPEAKLSSENIPPFSDKILSQTDEVEGNLADTDSSESRPAETASKAKVRALWGKGISTAPIDPRTVLLRFSEFQEPDVAARFTQLETRPAQRLFHEYELHYPQPPKLVKSGPEPETFTGSLSGRWSMAVRLLCCAELANNLGRTYPREKVRRERRMRH
jgi:hypothetical protein